MAWRFSHKIELAIRKLGLPRSMPGKYSAIGLTVGNRANSVSFLTRVASGHTSRVVVRPFWAFLDIISIRLDAMAAELFCVPDSAWRGPMRGSDVSRFA